MTDTTAVRLALGPLTAVTEALRDGVAVLDADGRFCYLNPAGAQLLQRPAEQLLGRPLAGVLPDTGGVPAFLAHARAADAPVNWRGRLAPDGPQMSVTAVVAAGLLQLTFHHAADEADDGSRGGGQDGDAERARLAYLAQVTETMSGTLNVGEAATRLAELAVPRLGDWAITVVRGEDGRPDEEGRAHRDPVRRTDVDTYRDGRRPVTTSTTPIATALLTGQPVRLPTLDQAQIAATLPTGAVAAAWRRLDTTSATIVPLRARGNTFGALTLMNSSTRPPHTDADVSAAVEVARRGALALDNARLYGRQLTVAETLQRSLLTPPPQPDRLQLAARYRPAARYQQVGGDWYDAFIQPDGATVLVIGDVAGHNDAAAAAMGQLRSILRGIAYDRPETPAQVLTRVDGVLNGLHVGTLATALVARIEQPTAQAARRERTLRWSSAGHLPPLLLNAGARVEVLDRPPQRLLGAGGAPMRTNHHVRLLPGATVLFYTDGLVEHGSPRGIDEGIARLVNALTQLAGRPLEELCDQLLDRLAPGRTADDIALLALRCDPDDGEEPTAVS